MKNYEPAERLLKKRDLMPETIFDSSYWVHNLCLTANLPIQAYLLGEGEMCLNLEQSE